MKAEERRSALPVKHEHDHELPTVIHHPEEDLPLLAQWLSRAMENQTRFWGLIGGVVVIAVALSVLGSGLSIGRATSDEAWTKLETAKTPGERVEIARDFPKTPAQRWALLQAATEYYNQGFNDLPSNREAARPNLKKALDLFKQVAGESDPDQPEARAAAFGAARTLEARSEKRADLDEAIKQYESIARNKAWTGTEEARASERLARELKSPEAEEFYTKLYAYKAPEASIPAGGVGNLEFPLPAGHPPVTAPTGVGVEPNPSALPPPPPSPVGETAPGPASKSETLPADPFAPKAAEAPKVPGLPDDVFAKDPGKPTPDAPK